MVIVRVSLFLIGPSFVIVCSVYVEQPNVMDARASLFGFAGSTLNLPRYS